MTTVPKVRVRVGTRKKKNGNRSSLRHKRLSYRISTLLLSILSTTFKCSSAHTNLYALTVFWDVSSFVHIICTKSSSHV